VIERKLETFLAGVIDVRDPRMCPATSLMGNSGGIRERGTHPEYRVPDLFSLARLAAPREVQKLTVQVARDSSCELLAILLQRAARRGIWSVARASSFGFTQMESTGVLTARGSP